MKKANPGGRSNDQTYPQTAPSNWAFALKYFSPYLEMHSDIKGLLPLCIVHLIVDRTWLKLHL